MGDVCHARRDRAVAGGRGNGLDLNDVGLKTKRLMSES